MSNLLLSHAAVGILGGIVGSLLGMILTLKQTESINSQKDLPNRDPETEDHASVKGRLPTCTLCGKADLQSRFPSKFEGRCIKCDY